jgi:mono/diheme cytochrome c family protein
MPIAFMFKMFIGLLLAFGWSYYGFAGEEATLVVESKTTTRSFSQSQLLKSSSLKSISVSADPAYPKSGKRMYQAIPLAEFMKGIAFTSSDTVTFHCKDGFVTSIAANRVLNSDPKKSVAFLAVEPTEATEKWPAVKAGESGSAGPFYLIWSHPEKSKISVEEWPYALTKLEVTLSLEAQYPQLVPQNHKESIVQGHGLFVKNCFVCHAFNGAGENKMGPVLNRPLSPTEYMKKNFLITLIRNPQALRKWPQSRMHGFDRSQLSDEELEKLIEYMSSMAKQRK